MCRRNKFAVSYGLIVKTKNNRVMLIKRKIPYCIQNFYVFLDDMRVPHDKNDHHPFYRLRDIFEKEWLPYLSKNDQIDYQCFQNGMVFEDMYDYPHGQLAVSKFPKNRYQCFMNAYREFREETGFRFSFTKEDILRYPLVTVKFNGCDQHEYIQHYFIVNNVKDLRRYRYFDSFPQLFISTIKIKNWKDDRLVYKSHLAPIDEAYRVLQEQQNMKKDFKHLLIQNSYHVKVFCPNHKNCVNWRCSTCRQNG